MALLTVQAVTRAGTGLAPAYAVEIPNGEERMIGPIDDAFRASNGLATITYSGVTALTIAAIRI